MRKVNKRKNRHKAHRASWCKQFHSLWSILLVYPFLLKSVWLVILCIAQAGWPARWWHHPRLSPQLLDKIQTQSHESVLDWETLGWFTEPPWWSWQCCWDVTSQIRKRYPGNAGLDSRYRVWLLCIGGYKNEVCSMGSWVRLASLNKLCKKFLSLKVSYRCMRFIYSNLCRCKTPLFWLQIYFVWINNVSEYYLF